MLGDERERTMHEVAESRRHERPMLRRWWESTFVQPIDPFLVPERESFRQGALPLVRHHWHRSSVFQLQRLLTRQYYFKNCINGVIEVKRG